MLRHSLLGSILVAGILLLCTNSAPSLVAAAAGCKPIVNSSSQFLWNPEAPVKSHNWFTLSRVAPLIISRGETFARQATSEPVFSVSHEFARHIDAQYNSPHNHKNHSESIRANQHAIGSPALRRMFWSNFM